MARELRLTVVFTPRMALILLVVVLVAAVPLELGSETMTMITTYPSPVGIYAKLVSTQATDLAREGGNVTVGKNNTTGTLAVGVPTTINVSATMGNALSVNGTTSLTGNVGVTGSANITGALSGGSISTTGSLTVTGTSTLGNVTINGGTLKIGSLNGTAPLDKQVLAYNAATQSVTWQTPSGSGSGGGNLIKVSGSNPTCPPNTTLVLTNWVAKTCPADLWASCTTASGWYRDAPACAQFPYDERRSTLTCTADSWSDVYCSQN